MHGPWVLFRERLWYVNWYGKITAKLVGVGGFADELMYVNWDWQIVAKLAALAHTLMKLRYEGL